MLTRLAILAALSSFLISVPSHAADKDKDKKAPKYAPTSQYEVRNIEGWRVLVNRELIEKEPELCGETLKLLEYQLFQIRRLVPKSPVEKLRKITIWVELFESHHPCMAYHPDKDWLIENDMNPEKGDCVEIANAKNFLDWNRGQPWMVFHELTHGYHDQFLPGGYDNPALKKQYEAAVKSKKYDSVLRFRSRVCRAYAMNNPMEYFAETSEAFFGSNDYYPFVASELEKHDPKMYELLKELWEVQ